MKRDGVLPAAVSLVIGLLLQFSVASSIKIAGIHPDPVGIVAIVTGFLWGPETGGVIGAVGGLVGDLVAGRFVGLLFLTRGLAGLVAGEVSQRVFKENMFVASMVCFVLSWVSDALAAVILLFNGFGVVWVHYAGKTGVKALVNALLALVVFTVLYKIKVRIASSDSTVLVE